MKNIVVVTLLLWLLIFFGALFASRKADCFWCPDIPCYGPGACPEDCFCVMPPGEFEGRCFSISE